MSTRFCQEFDDSNLREPFGQDGPGFAYNVLYPDGALERPVVSAFRSWLFEQAGAPVQ